jgi:DMSO/TMAO reductase YedYZ heme-binding membrane subunit
MSTARRYTAPLAFAGLLAGAAAVAASLTAYGTNAEGWQMAARYTARTSFVLFLVVYLAQPITRLIPAAVPIKRERRGLGLAFAGAHFIHLIALTVALSLLGDPPKLVTVTLGGFAFVVIAAMAATSNDDAVRSLGANWRRLHTFGLHYVWFIFVATYAGRVASNPNMPEYVVLIGAAIAALLLRISIPLLLPHRSTP